MLVVLLMGNWSVAVLCGGLEMVVCGESEFMGATGCNAAVQ